MSSVSDISALKQKIYNIIDTPPKKAISTSSTIREEPIQIIVFDHYEINFEIYNNELRVIIRVILADDSLSIALSSDITDHIKKVFPKGKFLSDGIVVGCDMSHNEFLSAIPSDLLNIDRPDEKRLDGRYHISVFCTDVIFEYKFAVHYSFNEQRPVINNQSRKYMCVSVSIKFPNIAEELDKITDFMKLSVDKVIDFTLKVKNMTALDPLYSNPLSVIKYLDTVITCSDIVEIILLYLLTPQYISKYHK